MHTTWAEKELVLANTPVPVGLMVVVTAEAEGMGFAMAPLLTPAQVEWNGRSRLSWHES